MEFDAEELDYTINICLFSSKVNGRCNFSCATNKCPGCVENGEINTKEVSYYITETDLEILSITKGPFLCDKFTTDKIIDAVLDLCSGLSIKKEQDLVWYLSRCYLKGILDVDNEYSIQEFAKRWLIGKRKLSAPGTTRKKKREKERRKLLNNLPAELITAVNNACNSEPARQYKAGNEKAINSLVGMVMKAFKFDPAVVKKLLQDSLTETST